jgi:iron complex transport system ATP-binding protein
VLLLDGRGGARAGPAAEVLDAARLSAAFGAPLDEVEVGGGRAFIAS